MEELKVSISDLRKISGIGSKTIDRIRESVAEKQDYLSKYNPDIHLAINQIHQGDCLDLMNGIPDKSIDMILCDLPYGRTNNKWDSVIPLEPLWQHYKRVIKDDGAILLFADGLFMAKIMHSNEEMWKYNIVWDKVLTSGFLNANRQPLRRHEEIVVYYKNQPTYNPQKSIGKPNHSKGKIKENNNNNYNNYEFVDNKKKLGNKKHPTSIKVFSKPHPSTMIHPTQKPVKLMEYLIKTYTKEGEVVLDNCIGSGTTAIACINTNRNFIGVELEQEYVDIAKRRIQDNFTRDVLLDNFEPYDDTKYVFTDEYRIISPWHKNDV